MLRHGIKQAVATLFYKFGIIRPTVRRENGFLIMMYHRVLDRDDPEYADTPPGLAVTTEVFEHQVRFLKRHFQPISMTELVTHLREGTPLPSQAVVISFDDGWRDNYVNALPILKELGLPAIMYLTTDFIGTCNLMWFDRVGRLLQRQALSYAQIAEAIDRVAAEHPEAAAAQSLKSADVLALNNNLALLMDYLKKLTPRLLYAAVDAMEDVAGVSGKPSSGSPVMVNWDEVRDMQANGIEFGSHGCSHTIMPRMETADLKRELIESKAIIEEHTGQPITLLAYPNGDYDDRVVKLVAEAGYVSAVTTWGDRSDTGLNILAIPRIGIHQGASVGLSDRFSEAVFAWSLYRASRRP